MRTKAVILVVALLAVIVGSVIAFLFVPGKPEYCWLVFGPEAKLRVLVRLQGSKVAIDRNGDGKLAWPGEYLGRIGRCRDIVITDLDERNSYTITSMSLDDETPLRRYFMVNVDIKGSLEYRQYCDVELTVSRDDAKEAHFHGPLTVAPTTILWKLPPNQALLRGDKPKMLRVNVGTMIADKGCWVVVVTRYKDQPAFPKGIHPVVNVEFPPKNPGEAPIRWQYPLDEPC